MYVRAIVTIIFLFATLAAFCAHRDTLRLYYSINGYHLSAPAKNKLKLYSDTLKKAGTIKIDGYADYLGSNIYNDSLSRKRAGEVKSYLLLLNAGLVIHTEGKGAVIGTTARGKNGEPVNRRVDVMFINKPVPKPPIADKPAPKPEVPHSGGNIENIAKLAIGKGMDLDSLMFEPGSPVLTKESLPFLDKLTRYLVENENLAFEIRGHICCAAPIPDGYNDAVYRMNDLSYNRAKTIYSHFIKNGISANRMKYTGVNSTQPKVFPEKNAHDQQVNRRVEIIIISK